MGYIKHIPPCNDDCAHCDRPMKKCYGGSDRKAYERGKKPKERSGGAVKISQSCGHRGKGRGRRV